MVEPLVKAKGRPLLGVRGRPNEITTFTTSFALAR
ncbi:unnamed protein product, partial [marine sediment metagenome]